MADRKQDEGAVSEAKPQVVRATIVIVNFNGGAHLQRCIASVLAQSEANFEVLIVDNASTDNSLDAMPSDARLRIIRLTDNAGFARANNLAIKQAQGDAVVLLNPDTIADRTWLKVLLDTATAHPETVMFGSLQCQAENPELIDGAGDVYFCTGTFWRGGHGQALAQAPALDGEAFAPCAAAALYRREPLIAVGGFDESYFCYAEDIDLAFRLRLAGGRCLQVGDARVLHVGSALAGRGSAFSLYHLTRNSIWTFFKCMPAPLLLFLVVPHGLMLTWFYVRARKSEHGDAVARGIRDGFGDLGRVLKLRKSVQSGRQVSVFHIARALCWSPVALRQRSIRLRPVGTPSARPH